METKAAGQNTQEERNADDDEHINDANIVVDIFADMVVDDIVADIAVGIVVVTVINGMVVDDVIP